jgi:hypothetical protein
MLLPIALVGRKRCRPSPDAVPEGAPADRDARGIVTAGFPGRVGVGLLPVLGAPLTGVGGVDGDDGDAEFGRHADEPGPPPRKQTSGEPGASKQTRTKKTGGAQEGTAAKKAAADKKPAGNAATAKATRPTLVELIRSHLTQQSEPRSAADVTTALDTAHPERGVKTTVVRTTLEILVAKNQAQRTKQGSSVYYAAPQRERGDRRTCPGRGAGRVRTVRRNAAAAAAASLPAGRYAGRARVGPHGLTDSPAPAEPPVRVGHSSVTVICSGPPGTGRPAPLG